MSEDPNVHPHWAAEAKQIARSIDSLDYFEVLGVPMDAALADLKERYHSLQRNYHPDTFYGSPDSELKVAVMRISKRVAEAWVVLRDAEKRTKYMRDVTGPERMSKLRYTEQSEQEARREKDEELGKTVQGRQLVQKALAAAKGGDLAGAVRDLKMALLFEKNNELLKKKLTDLEAELKAKGPPPKSPGNKPMGR